MANFNTKKLLEDFNADTEEELFDKLVKDSQTVPCLLCKKEFPIELLNFIDGDPYCKKCSKEISSK